MESSKTRAAPDPASDEVPGPQRAIAPILMQEMSVSDAFAAVARSTLEHLQANKHGVLAQDDPEFLHQMRVALRRLRSAFSAFAAVLPEASREPIAGELKWLNGALGSARDWDVFVTQTLPPILQAYQDRPALETLVDAALRRQRAAHVVMRRALRSRRCARTLAALDAWLTARAWCEHTPDEARAALDAPVLPYAQSELAARYERMSERGRALGELTGRELHQLRIAIKKLRYSVDFFSSLFDADSVWALRSRLSSLQDTLGTINDAATMQNLLAGGFGRGRSAAMAEARGILLGWSAGRGDALRSDLDRAWKALRHSETFW